MHGPDAKLTLEGREPHGVVATIELPRSGARAARPSAPAAGAATSAAAEGKPTATRRTLQAMGVVERWWRKGLSFAFVGLVAMAAVFAGLAIVAITTGVMPVHIGAEQVGGPTGAVLGTAGILVAFCAIVLALAVVAAVIYGLGFVLLGVAIFVPLVVLISLMPVLAPVVLLGLLAWWLVRRNRKVESPHGNGDPG